MNCETCNDHIMDLLYDELDEATATSARAHIEGCPTCSDAWTRVSRGRALASTLSPVTAPLPSAALLAAVEAAARQGADQPGERASPVAPLASLTGGAANDSGVSPVVPLENAPRRLPTWLHRLGDLAMRRQVAMAAVALLSIGLASRFVPSHTPGAIDGEGAAPAPQVIPAQELPVERPAAVASPLTAAPRARMLNRSAEAHRAQRAAPRLQAAQDQAPMELAPALAESSNTDGLAQNVVPSQVTTRAVTGGAPGAPTAARGAVPSDARYRRDEVSPPNAFNTPAPVVTAERELGRALPAAPAAQAAPVWRSSSTTASSADDLRAQGSAEASIAAYRAALDADPPAAERTRLATALAAQLTRAGRISEAEVVRARYLRPQADSAAQVEVARTPANSVPHVPSSVPHPSMQRPARRSMPSSTNIQAY